MVIFMETKIERKYLGHSLFALFLMGLMIYATYTSYDYDRRMLVTIVLGLFTLFFMGVFLYEFSLFELIVKAKKNPLYCAELDSKSVIEAFEEKKADSHKKYKRIMSRILYIAPIVLAVSIVLGVRFRSVFLTLVLPTLFAVLYIIFYVIFSVNEDFKQTDDEIILKEKSIVLVGENVLYVAGEAFFYKKNGFKIILKDGSLYAAFTKGFMLSKIVIKDEEVFNKVYELVGEK